MSTRATIKIKEGNDEIWLYHHSDGYPEGVGSALKEYLPKFGYWNQCWIANELVKGAIDNGYEITTCQHGDEEFAYLIDCDKHELKCYSVGWDEFDWKETKIVEIP